MRLLENAARGVSEHQRDRRRLVVGHIRPEQLLHYHIDADGSEQRLRGVACLGSFEPMIGEGSLFVLVRPGYIEDRHEGQHRFPIAIFMATGAHGAVDRYGAGYHRPLTWCLLGLDVALKDVQLTRYVGHLVVLSPVNCRLVPTQ